MATLCDILLNHMNLVCNNIVTATDGIQAQVTQSAWDNDLNPDTQSVLDDIATIHGTSSPSYTPRNAGDENATVDTSSMSTEEMGSDACERATAAYNKVCVDDPTNHEDSSTKLYELNDVIQDLRAKAEPSP